MSISSMTGFARSEGSRNGLSWSWDIRSVNGRGLDARFRIPGGFEQLEGAARELMKRELTRGSLQIAFNYEREQGDEALVLNRDLLRQVLTVVSEIREETGIPSEPDISTLLSFRGVVDSRHSAHRSKLEEETAAEILACFGKALKSLRESRRAEGAELQPVLSGHLDEIGRLVDEAEANPARTPEAIAERLKTQVSTLLEAHGSFDADRLYQEAVLLATKADIREELDRLKAHISSARALLASGEPVGRKLDFLTQEFNREANTLCSKSNDKAITAIGLAMKAAIDQLREQVQNVE